MTNALPGDDRQVRTEAPIQGVGSPTEPSVAQRSPQAPQGRPWRSGIIALGVLGPLFFVSYGFANWVALQRASVPSIVFGWEHNIPFVAWTIVPYWIIDLLYGISLVLCATKTQLRIHVTRLVFVQCAAVLCFLLFPLRFTFERPVVDGSFGWMFAALESFDQPFNQAPSLHVALLVVLLPVYLRAVPPRLYIVVYAVALLIGASVLTTWQHHFIDIPTGVWLGAFAVWLLRDDAPRCKWQWKRARCAVRRRLAAYYAAGGALCAVAAVLGQGAWFWLLWPASALTLVALVYLIGDGHAFAKNEQGNLSVASRLLFGPYLVGARINALLWTRRDPQAAEVHGSVYIGTIVRPWLHSPSRSAAVVDLCAEIGGNADEQHYAAIPMLDLVAPTPDEIARAVHRIVEAHRHGPVLVACALGYSRSASAIVAWIVHTGREASIESAIERLRRVRPRIVLGEGHHQAVRTFLNTVPCDLERIEPIPGPIPMNPALQDRTATR